MLVGVGIGRAVDPNDTAEFSALAASAGTLGVGLVLASRARPDPKYFVGSGKAEEIRACAEEHDADVVLVDQTLTPSQERNLEKLTGRRVLDRNGLILDIFAQRARSFEGKLQVELAQLSHLATRLVRGWTHLERQKGGIGLRGPGETQLETDRRLIAKRIRTLKARLEKLARQRDTSRHVRREVPVPTVALVGYTNAGKSTLFNALSHSNVLVSPKMFATLDPTVRALRLPSNRRALFSDTVGFIRDLPKPLLAAFRATLEEVEQASVIVQVSDISNTHQAEQDAEVEKVLADLGVDARPRIRVFNKIDRLDADSLAALVSWDGNVYVSALRKTGLDELLRRVDAAMPVDPLIRLRFSVPLADGRTLALVHGLGRVRHSEVRGVKMHLDADLPESLARRLHLGPAVAESSAPIEHKNAEHKNTLRNAPRKINETILEK